jgi:hypothetical protein
VNVLVEAFVLLLPATLEIPGVPCADVCALKVPPEDPDQVFPFMDLCWWEVHEPGSGEDRQKEGEVTNDEVIIICSPKLAG